MVPVNTYTFSSWSCPEVEREEEILSTLSGHTMSGQQKDQRPQVAKNHSVPHSSTTSKHQAYRTWIIEDACWLFVWMRDVRALP